MQLATESGAIGQLFGHRQIQFLVRIIMVVFVIVALMLVLDWMLRSGTMPIEEITFKGRFKNISHSQLEKVVARHLKNNLLMVNPDVVQKDIEKLPWIYRASVRRKWPSGLYIEFMEQVPVARWGEQAWLNSAGDIIQLDNVTGSEVFPTITGAKKDSAQLLQAFKSYQKLFQGAGISLTRLDVSKRNSFQLTTASGVTIILGKQNIQLRIKRFLGVYQKTLAMHQGGFSRVDLRYTNGFAVLWNETASVDKGQNVSWGSYDKT